MEATQMVVHLMICSWPWNIAQLDLYNTTTAMNGGVFQIIALKFLLKVSVAEAADVVEVEILEEDMAL